MAVAVPHPLVRALVVTPVAFVGSLIVTILSPLLHAILALIDLFDRKNWRFTRVGGLGIAFCVVELFGLTLAFGIWVLSGFGLWMKSKPIHRMNRWVMDTWLELITRAIRAFIGFDVAFPSDDLQPGPALVLSRHAGPGDALLVARSLTHDHDRQLRMLGTTKLLWDPFFNHLVKRLPFYFCEPQAADPQQQLADIQEAARTIEDDGAMVIFPEGGNFTPTRQAAAWERLEARHDEEHLKRARKMTHVLPPRSGGTLAAIEAAPEANILLLAHVGLDDLFSLRDIWESVPLKRTVRASFWYASDKPPSDDREAMINWLYDEWERVDAWIDEEFDSVLGD